MKHADDLVTVDCFDRDGNVVLSDRYCQKPCKGALLVQFDLQGRPNVILRCAADFSGTEVEAVRKMQGAVNSWAEQAVWHLTATRKGH